MPFAPAARRCLTLLSVPLCGIAVAACGTTLSTGNYRGEQRAVAQAIANLQADVTAGEQKKVCANDVSATVVKRLGGTKGCESTIKAQLGEIDNLETKIQSLEVGAGGKTATVQVKTGYAGKPRLGTMSLVKEGSEWKISGVS
jgi:hypothetical protein